jgi:hypothetical protein
MRTRKSERSELKECSRIVKSEEFVGARLGATSNESVLHVNGRIIRIK